MASSSVCPKCGGVGWVIVERANVSGAQVCECRVDNRQSRFLATAQIPPLYATASFETFRLPSNEENPVARKDLQSVMTTVAHYANAYPAVPKPGLLLIGDQGVGKTHLAVSAMRRIIEKGHECVFCDYQTLLDKIRAGFDETSGMAAKDAYRIALEAPVLLLDDLGAHRGTEWVEDTITSIITHRCNQQKPLIATTNLPDPAAGSQTVDKGDTGQMKYRRTLSEGIGARARSRLFEMCTVVRIPNVEDYRIKKAKKF